MDFPMFPHVNPWISWSLASSNPHGGNPGFPEQRLTAGPLGSISAAAGELRSLEDIRRGEWGQ